MGIAAFSLGTSAANGQTVGTWTGAGDGITWSDPENWASGVVPDGAADEASINIATTAPALDTDVLLDSLTIGADGVLTVGNGNDLSASTVSNAGDIVIAGIGTGFTDFEITSGGTLLSGGGTVTLTGAGARITETANGIQTLTVGDQTIQGQGNIGINLLDLELSSESTIAATVADSTLLIDPAEATSTTNLLAAGTLFAAADARLEVLGAITSTETGILAGNGTIAAANSISIDGLVSAGESVGELTLEADGTISLGDTSQFLFEIEGAGTGEFDFLQFDAQFVGLGGDLLVDLVDFIPDVSDVFLISALDDPSVLGESFGGMFDNLQPENLIETVDGEGTFIVTVGTNSISLSNFTATAVPEPGSATLLMMLALPLAIRRRRAELGGDLYQLS